MENLGYVMNNSDIFTGCYFQSVKCVIFTLKITINCDVTSCIACCVSDFKVTRLKTEQNVINRKFQCFDVGYGINFTRRRHAYVTGF